MMPFPTMDIRKVTYVAVPLYVCVACGKQAPGRPVTVETNAPVLALRGNIPNMNMPIGWAGYGADVHKCPGCQS